MKLYIFNYLNEFNGTRTNTLTTTNKETIDYAIEYAEKRNWKFEVLVSDIKTQGKNESQLHRTEVYHKKEGSLS